MNRLLIGLLIALAGAPSAEAETFRMCSGKLAITIDNVTAKASLGDERLEFMGGAGLGLNGFTLQNQGGQTERLYTFSLDEAPRISDADNEPAKEIWVFRDRAFWPCK